MFPECSLNVHQAVREGKAQKLSGSEITDLNLTREQKNDKKRKKWLEVKSVHEKASREDLHRHQDDMDLLATAYKALQTRARDSVVRWVLTIIMTEC
jgi:hypothetical protein